MAMEELKKVHREKELLLATLGKKEAEAQSNIAECEVLKQKLNLVETTMTTGGNCFLLLLTTSGVYSIIVITFVQMFFFYSYWFPNDAVVGWFNF